MWAALGGFDSGGRAGKPSIIIYEAFISGHRASERDREDRRKGRLILLNLAKSPTDLDLAHNPQVIRMRRWITGISYICYLRLVQVSNT